MNELRMGDEADLFKKRCSGYMACRKMMEVMEKSDPGLKKMAETPAFRIRESRAVYGDPQRNEQIQYGILKQETGRIEQEFAAIRNRKGERTALILWQLYVEKCKQADIANRYGLSLRTMQRRIRETLQDVLEDADE